MQFILAVVATIHFVLMAQAILDCGAGFEVAWPSFIAVFAIGFFALSLFRRSLASA